MADMSSPPHEGCTPKPWKRYAVCTVEVFKKGYAEKLTEHLNTINDTQSFKYIHDKEENWSIQLLDMLLESTEDGRVKVKGS